MFVLINIAMWSTSFAVSGWSHHDSPCPKGIYFDAGDYNKDVRWSKADKNLETDIGISKDWGYNTTKDGGFTHRESKEPYSHSDKYADYNFWEDLGLYWIFDLGLDLLPSSDSPSAWKFAFRYRTDTEDVDLNGEEFTIRIKCIYMTRDLIFPFEETTKEINFRDDRDLEEGREFKEKCQYFNVPNEMIQGVLNSSGCSTIAKALEDQKVMYFLDKIVCDTN